MTAPTEHHELPSDSTTRHPPQSWRVLLTLYGITSMVEAIGISQIFAFLPQYLRSMGVPQAQVGPTDGILSSLVFVLGLPLVPLWGVWADKYSRKAVIIRSAIVEAVVFGGVGLSRAPWQLALTLLLVGFQLGNTGVMLSALRDVSPHRRLGTVIALFGATSPVGFAIGPAVGAFMIDGLHLPISAVYFLSALLSLGVALMLAIGSREVRPERVPTGSVGALAFGAMRGVLTDPAIRNLFVVFGLALFARQIANPFLPLAVDKVNAGRPDLATAIALVVGVAALVGALLSPIAGTIGDRIGFRPVLLSALFVTAVSFAVLPLMPSIPAMALVAVVYAAATAAVSTMVFGLVSLEVAAERRSTTLNLVYLPLYIVGIVGPAIGAVVVGIGLEAVFVLAALLVGASGVVVLRHRPGGDGLAAIEAGRDAAGAEMRVPPLG